MNPYPEITEVLNVVEILDVLLHTEVTENMDIKVSPLVA
jgi:hypothetical protein